MKQMTNVELFGGERATPDARGIRLDDTDRGPNESRGDPETSANTTDCGRRRGYERISTKVDIEHQRVRALDQNLLTLADCLVYVCYAIDDIGPEPLCERLANHTLDKKSRTG